MLKILCFVLGGIWAAAAAADDDIVVGVGRVWVVQAPEPIVTVVVGDPGIADVVVDGNTSVVLFGKKVGETDLVLLDANQMPILESRVLVGRQANSGVVIVRRPADGGVSEESWVCSATCTKVSGGP